MDLLEAAPATAGGRRAGVERRAAVDRAGAREWSANEVLAHLRACADVWGAAIATILDEDHPTIRAVNPRTWIDSTDYVQQAFGASLRAFTKQRVELMARLRPLTPEDWLRSATITGAGRPLQWSVQSYADRMAVHERSHIKQPAADDVRSSTTCPSCCDGRRVVGPRR